MGRKVLAYVPPDESIAEPSRIIAAAEARYLLADDAEIRHPRGPVVELVPVGAIRPSPDNPRIFREGCPALAGLAESIRAQGVIQPVVVRPLANDEGATLYQLVAGERRWRASVLAGRETVPAVVREDLDDATALELTVLENMQREDLSPLEEARGVASLLAGGQDVATVADRLGRPARWVARRASLSSLTQAWRDRIVDAADAASNWTAVQLEVVARLPAATQDRLAASLCRYQGYYGGGQVVVVSKVELERQVARELRELSTAPWSLEAQFAGAPACSACPQRSSCAPLLFEDALAGHRGEAGDQCLDPACWDAKMTAWLTLRVTELRAEHGDDLVLVTVHYGAKGSPFGKPVYQHELDLHKEPKKGRSAGVYIDGPSVGALVWVRPIAGSRQAAAGAAKGKTLAEKRVALDCRRAARAVEMAREIVLAAPQPDLQSVVRLAAIVGTAHRQESAACASTFYGSHPLDSSDRADWAAITRNAQDYEAAVAALWRGARDVVAQALGAIYSPSDVPRQHLPYLRALAPLLGVDVDALLEQARAAIAEPKAWAKEEAAAAAAAEAAKVEKPKRARRAAVEPGESVGAEA